MMHPCQSWQLQSVPTSKENEICASYLLVLLVGLLFYNPFLQELYFIYGTSRPSIGTVLGTTLRSCSQKIPKLDILS